MGQRTPTENSEQLIKLHFPRYSEDKLRWYKICSLQVSSLPVSDRHNILMRRCEHLFILFCIAYFRGLVYLSGGVLLSVAGMCGGKFIPRYYRVLVAFPSAEQTESKEESILFTLPSTNGFNHNTNLIIHLFSPNGYRTNPWDLIVSLKYTSTTDTGKVMVLQSFIRVSSCYGFKDFIKSIFFIHFVQLTSFHKCILFTTGLQANVRLTWKNREKRKRTPKCENVRCLM